MDKTECQKQIQDVETKYKAYIDIAAKQQMSCGIWKKYPSPLYSFVFHFFVLADTALLLLGLYGATYITLWMLTYYSAIDIGFENFIALKLHGSANKAASYALVCGLVLFPLRFIRSLIYPLDLTLHKRHNKDNVIRNKEVYEKKEIFISSELSLISCMEQDPVDKQMYTFNDIQYRINNDKKKIKKDIKYAIEEKIKEIKKENEKKRSAATPAPSVSPKYSTWGNLKNRLVSSFIDISGADSITIRCLSCDWNSYTSSSNPNYKCCNCGAVNYVIYTLNGTVCTKCGSTNVVAKCPKCGGNLK